MLNITIDEDKGIAYFEPDGKLSESDFKSATRIIDSYLDKSGRLHALIISTPSFPGWKSFAALLSHLSFVKGHHKKIQCIALVTDSPMASFAEHAVKHFVSAEVKAFKYSELDVAKKWVDENYPV